MRHVLVDTNAYVAFKRGDKAALEVLRHAPRIGLSSVVLGELLAGFACASHEARNRAELAAFLESPRVQLHPVTVTTADHYAVLFASLRAQGTPIPTNDLWIAATAMEHGYALFTLDGHFAHVSTLRCGTQVDDFTP